MSTIAVPKDVNLRHGLSGGRTTKKINLTQATWHAAFAGGAGAIDVSAGFTDPDSTEADRVPELALTAGGTPGAYTLTGTYDSKAITEQITTVAGSTVKATQPFDTITRVQGPDPGGGKSVTLYKGDSWANPAARCVQVGTVGDVACQLEGESAVKTVDVPLPGDWERCVQRVAHSGSGTTAAKLWFVW